MIWKGESIYLAFQKYFFLEIDVEKQQKDLLDG